MGCHLPAVGPNARLLARQRIRDSLLVWLGDFNFRLQHLNAEVALGKVKKGRTMDLINYDELQDERWNADLRRDDFHELKIEFSPTYKKSHERKSGIPPESKFALFYRTRWYKGRKLRTAVPSWCDRIFLRSAEGVKGDLVGHSYRSSEPLDEYSIFSRSDHDPISLGLLLAPSS
eukprot:GHVO01011447.1.p2 GENE.GHVO01011447.1~~GHVO01011447.1.p2  ORF type:complete len:175 (+),score=8.96 GHVO01011447.1:519-1043(+)